MWDLLGGAIADAWRQRLQFAVAPGLNWGRMARAADWKLILAPGRERKRGMGADRGRTGDTEYVFHLGADPEERSNLAGGDALEADWLRSRLNRWWTTWESRQQNVAEDALDPAIKKRLEALGYLVH